MTITGDSDGEGDDSLSFEVFGAALRFFGLLVFLTSIKTETVLFLRGRLLHIKDNVYTQDFMAVVHRCKMNIGQDELNSYKLDHRSQILNLFAVTALPCGGSKAG